METFLSLNQKHLLWKDEVGDDFILLKYAEVYRFSENAFRLHIWSSKKLSQLLKNGLIFGLIGLDEGFTIAHAKVTNLSQLIALGAFKRRPNINGNWIKSKEKILAHRIFPYKPVIFQQKVTFSERVSSPHKKGVF